MTGYIETSGSMPLSRMTAGSLQDMTYTVNKAAADAYSLPSCSPTCAQFAPQMNIASREILLEPVGVVNRDGSVRRLEPGEHTHEHAH